MIANFFIERPVLANVIAILTMLIGAVAILALPIAQYPPITPPTIQVTASYPGASARTVIDTVALPIEQQVNEVKDLLYMQSTSTNDGKYALAVTFRPGTDLNDAQVLVQNRVATAVSKLPQAVQQQGVVTKQKSTAILQIVTLSSAHNQYSGLALANFATARIRDQLARLPGVGDVTVFGAGQYSMRVWLNPELMRARGITPADVSAAIGKQSQRVTAGQIGMPPAEAAQDLQLTVNVDGNVTSEEDFRAIIVKSAGTPGAPLTRLGDIARVELGSVNYGQFFTYDGSAAAGIAIYQAPDANALSTTAAVAAKIKALSAAFPSGLVYQIPLDTTVFVSESIHEVYKTLVEAGVLVLLVIVVFLQDWRATLIPATTVPVTIIGAFAAMAALGFSINLLTLFAIVLSIGIVVDDAIVVVEGVTHHIERGLAPRAAAAQAMKELLGPIIGITLVLMSVFLPAAFMPGVTGAMYRQFALVIAATAAISAVNAVTLKPTQSAQWLRPQRRQADGTPLRKNAFYRGFDRVYAATERRYVALVGWIIGRCGQAALIALGLIALAGFGLSRVPTGFIPNEDQGYLMVIVQLPDAASLQRTGTAMAQMAAEVRKVPGVDHLISIGGVSPLDNNASLANAGILYVVLEPWEERATRKGGDLRSIYAELQRRLRTIPEASALITVPPPIPGLGLSGGFQLQTQLTDGSLDYDRLHAITERIAERAAKEPSIAQAFTPFRASAPQLAVHVDRARAEALNVATGDVFDALQGYLGSSYASQFTRFGQTLTVFVQADEPYRHSADAIGRLAVRSRAGAMVPLSAIADVTHTTGPAIVSLYNMFPSASVNGGTAPGYSSGESIAALERIAGEVLPSGTAFEWTGMAYQEKIAGSAALLIFALSIILVYFVLAGQYESWITPLAVVGSVPLALLGTVAVLLLVGLPNNIYVQIGLVLLIALSAKNAILIVEVARELRVAGQTIVAAALEAARIRLRPIVMTSFAFILGVLPLVLASGAGAAARKSIGIAVFSGMLASTCLALLFVPALFVVLQRFAERRTPASEATTPCAG